MAQSTALQLKEETVDRILMKVQKLNETGELDLPANYSPANALKSAWLILQDTRDKDKNPVLQVCTRESIANSLLDMVVQGLNPVKKQCYFIAYGKQLACMRSYFGAMAVARRVDPTIADDGIIAAVVYEGDTFKYKLVRGMRQVTDHEQSLENVDRGKVKAAYCEVYDRDGKLKRSEIMTMDEIKQAWKQSQTRPVDDNGNVKAGSTHDKFAADMAIKTVINKTLKPIINSSSDENLLLHKAIHRSDETRAYEEAQAEVDEHANTGPVVDVEPQSVTVHSDEQEPVKQEAVVGGPGF